ncbi:unnamed protein product [Amoebophrya sp. A25]|nr:unnamed protein product [Amoebophrya sp. A25]|eukprot:GSA25T00008759001.1
MYGATTKGVQGHMSRGGRNSRGRELYYNEVAEGEGGSGGIGGGTTSSSSSARMISPRVDEAGHNNRQRSPL